MDREFHEAVIEFLEHPPQAGSPWAYPRPEPTGARRIIRCSPQNTDRAVCRAISRAVMRGELWRVEVTK
jgi:hypothetical protein